MYKFSQKEYLNPLENININKCLIANGREEIHTHEFIELVYIAGGHGTHTVDGVPYRVKKGDILYINYNQTHSYVSDGEMIFYNLLYVPEFFGRELIHSEDIYEIFQISLFEEFGGEIPAAVQMVSFEPEEISSVEYLIKNMYTEFRNKLPGYKSILSGYSRVLFSRILRKQKCGIPEYAARYIDKISEDFIKYIDSICFKKVSLKEIAEQCFYNPSYLSRAFKKYCGKSLSEYLKEKRIAEAASLLEHTDNTVESIMNSVGYSDSKLFYKHFREIYNITPREYRKSKNSQ